MRAITHYLLVILTGLALFPACSNKGEETAAESPPETRQTSPAVSAPQAESTTTTARALPGEGEDAGKTVMYRDTWGVPHIYAPTVEAGLYAMGYGQAADRPEQLLRNFLLAMGEMASVAGPDYVQSDLRSRMFDHYGIAKSEFDQIPEDIQNQLRAFANGMNDYYADHPEDKPDWWGDRQIDPYMAVAFGRLFLYNWSIDEAYGDLKRGGIEPGYEPAQRGSNEWAVSPGRSAEDAAILYVDPHLSWWGPSRFWAFRIHAGNLEGSGVTLPGSPYIGLGHNANVAWAMTTGGPDTADIYELTINPDNPDQYKYDDAWVDFQKKEVTLQVEGKEAEKHTILYARQGPVVAIHDGKAYAAAMAYMDSIGNTVAWHTFNFAQDYHGVEEGLATLDVFPQNVMVADTSGNIYYQRTGRVPVRPEGYDWSKPVNGSTSATAWQGFHPASDLLQVLNPPQGYMQNCNIPPDAMMPNSPFNLENTKPYIYASRDYGSSRAGWINQRGARAIQLLSNDDSVTVEDALRFAVDVHIYGSERWVDVLRKAHEKFGDSYSDNANYTAGIKDILAWNREISRDSTGGLKYYYWRRQLVDDHGADAVNAVAERIDQWYKIVTGEPVTGPNLTDSELQSAASSFANAMDRLASEMGSLDAAYGDKFRVGRDEVSWPVGGGGSYGTRTLRSVSYGDERDDFTQWGRSGQTSTQIVVLTKPIQSWWYLPIGESDHPDSPHYRDLAEKAFSPRQLQPTWWRPQDLADHIESRLELTKAPA